MPTETYQAVILDLDGVITQTASLHAQAWQQMFNDYLQQRSDCTSESYDPFNTQADYRQYVDGKPRYDGVRSFLAARGIDLPEGQPEDKPGQETICGLGNRKNAIFLELVEEQGVEVFDDTVEQLHRWRGQGMKTAVVSSSRNCEHILKAVGLLDLFDAKIDGVDSNQLGLEGKPAPDIFLTAAEKLQVVPQQAIAIEDAISGVKAGRAGEFGLVLGVARDSDGADLKQHGADRVVHSLDELQVDDSAGSSPEATGQFDEIIQRLQGKELALFTDYDGTLTPIVAQPEAATLSDEMRSLLAELAGHCTVAVISGRDLADVQQMVGLDSLYYAGSHGFDIAGPDVQMQQAEAQASLTALATAEQWLRHQLDPLAGVRIERKRFAIAIHHRAASDKAVQQVAEAVKTMVIDHPQLRQSRGKKIFELQPDVEWDKGRAILWLLDQLDLDKPSMLPMYLGDDTTDEDGFRALSDRGIGIRVGAEEPTQAAYRLKDPEDVQAFFQALLPALDPQIDHG